MFAVRLRQAINGGGLNAVRDIVRRFGCQGMEPLHVIQVISCSADQVKKKMKRFSSW